MELGKKDVHPISRRPPQLYAGGTINRRQPVSMTAAEIMAKYRLGDLVDSTKDEQDAKGAAMGGTQWALHTFYQGAENGAGAKGDDEGNTLARSIVNKGYDSSKPILLNPSHSQGPTVVDGHHRLAVMFKHSPHEPIPVMFTNDENYFGLLNEDPNKLSKQINGVPAMKATRTNIYGGNCRACGQFVPEGKGVIIKVQGKNRPFHVYHPEHLTPAQQALYPSKKLPNINAN
jgi:hypothetical protein